MSDNNVRGCDIHLFHTQCVCVCVKKNCVDQEGLRYKATQARETRTGVASATPTSGSAASRRFSRRRHSSSNAAVATLEYIYTQVGRRHVETWIRWYELIGVLFIMVKIHIIIVSFHDDQKPYEFKYRFEVSVCLPPTHITVHDILQALGVGGQPCLFCLQGLWAFGWTLMLWMSVCIGVSCASKVKLIS